MTTNESTIAHALESADGLLRIEFFWTGDRFAHRIVHQSNPWLSSVEGSANDDWPASPALQQLSSETIEDCPMIFGVGGSGTSHFSVAIKRLGDNIDGSGFQFDWAVRLSKTGLETLSQRQGDGLESLGTTYQADDASFTPSGLQPMDSARIIEGMGTASEQYCIAPPQETSDQTIQWSYQVRLD